MTCIAIDMQRYTKVSCVYFKDWILLINLICTNTLYQYCTVPVMTLLLLYLHPCGECLYVLFCLLMVDSLYIVNCVLCMCVCVCVIYAVICTVRYLYHEVSAFRAGDNDCILEHSIGPGNSLLRVKVGTTFHLYVSAPPCGDASLFSR